MLNCYTLFTLLYLLLGCWDPLLQTLDALKEATASIFGTTSRTHSVQV